MKFKLFFQLLYCKITKIMTDNLENSSILLVQKCAIRILDFKTCFKRHEAIPFRNTTTCTNENYGLMNIETLLLRS